MKRKLARRWVINLLTGRPEPRFSRFAVSAVGVVWDEAHIRVLMMPGTGGDTLPRVMCDGRRAPWDALTDFILQNCGIRTLFQWVGVWQDTGRNRLEFVFAATDEEGGFSDNGEWTLARNAPLEGLDAAYIERVKATYRRDPVWSITQESGLEQGDTIRLDEGK